MKIIGTMSLCIWCKLLKFWVRAQYFYYSLGVILCYLYILKLVIYIFWSLFINYDIFKIKLIAIINQADQMYTSNYVINY